MQHPGFQFQDEWRNVKSKLFLGSQNLKLVTSRTSGDSSSANSFWDRKAYGCATSEQVATLKVQTHSVSAKLRVVPFQNEWRLLKWTVMLGSRSLRFANPQRVVNFEVQTYSGIAEPRFRPSRTSGEPYRRT
jgi:hypothetical protein